MPGDDAVITITNKNFEDIVLAEDVDVVLLLHAQACESCAHLAVYFKRMALRFKDLNIPSLVIAQMDTTEETPPANLRLLNSELPIIALLPAVKSSGDGGGDGYAKVPPFLFYSGLGKVTSMMKWVQQHSTIPFELPNLPHLTEEQKVLYKQQVREREEYLANKREEEDRSAKEEELAQKRLRDRVAARQREEEKLNGGKGSKETVHGDGIKGFTNTVEVAKKKIVEIKKQNTTANFDQNSRDVKVEDAEL